MNDNPNWPDPIAGRIIPDEFSRPPQNGDPYQLALELAPYPVLLASLEGLNLEWGNVAAERFLQIDRADFKEFVFADFVPEPALLPFWRSIADLQKGHSPTVSTLISAEDGVDVCRVNLAITDQHLIAIGQNAPSNEAVALQTDALTGLPDRRVLQTQVEAALRRKKQDWGLLFIDLNHYKRVNDRYGHVVGDRVLQDFAKNLRASSRPNDLVVRYGGDEFVVFVDRIPSEKELRAMAGRIARNITAQAEGTSESIQVSCSVGCAIADASFTTVEEIIFAADRDMYQQKQSHDP